MQADITTCNNVEEPNRRTAMERPVIDTESKPLPCTSAVVQNIFGPHEKIGRKTLQTDSGKSQISSKTSRGKRDSTKRHHQRHH